MAQEFIVSHCHHATTDNHNKDITFAITTKAAQGNEGKGVSILVGTISLKNVVAKHLAELGYWIGQPYWGHGHATEAARAVLRHAFQELALERVWAQCLTRNPASGRVLQKIGMCHEGCQRSHVLKWGVLEDIELYGILKNEWRHDGQQVNNEA